LQTPDTLKKMLFCAARKTNIPDEDMDILLPEKVMGLEELRQHPSSLKEGPLVEILSEVTRELLKSEVTFKSGLPGKQGLVFALREGEIMIELTDEALTNLLLTHLQPRFRAILEGVVA
jgi:V/A-type H+/Na+-transporting ATPase subunit E